MKNDTLELLGARATAVSVIVNLSISKPRCQPIFEVASGLSFVYYNCKNSNAEMRDEAESYRW